MKNVIAIAISALFATAAFASPITVPATVSTGGVAGLAGVSAAVGGTSSASLAGGSSQSGAQSLQAATIAVTSSYNIPGGAVGQAATATIGAVGTTSSQNYAYNLSSGAASGGAATVGQAFQGAAGSAQTHSSNTSNAEIPTGYASGAEGSSTGATIIAGTNQGAAISSVSGGNFGAEVGFTTNNTSVSVPTDSSTVSTQNGDGVQLTAGAIGGTYASTSSADGVYADGNAIDFGGNSNQIPTTITVTTPGSWNHPGSTTTVANPALSSTASGSFSASANIGALSTTAPISDAAPL
jgi:hypothetical protein